MNAYLFVYGSLVSAADHPQGHRLRQEATLVAPAVINGQLYRVSWYPALRPALAECDRVHGEVYRLNDSAASLAWLDEYEGITQGGSSAAASDEYLRVERQVTLADGACLNVWVYLYRRPLPESAFVADGIWRR